MCQEIHNIPHNIIKDGFQDLEKLSGDMYKKHLDFFNNKEHHKSLEEEQVKTADKSS